MNCFDVQISDPEVNYLSCGTQKQLSYHGFYSYLVQFSAVLPDPMIGQGLYFDLLFKKTWVIAEILAFRKNRDIVRNFGISKLLKKYQY
jgi:hypothetical protein